MAHALVTGATGYIGSNLVAGLLDANWTVSVIVRENSSVEILSPFSGKINIFKHNGSMKTMSEILAASQPDVVYHLAAMVSAEHVEEDIEPLITSNILFSTQLAEAMFRNKVKCLINTETFWQHKTGADEFEPVNLYAATKQGARDILKYYTSSCELNVISLVLFDTYGANDFRKKLFSLLKQSIREDLPLDMTLGEQLIDLVHIDDVVAAYIHAGKMLMKGRYELDTYAVTSESKMTLRNLIEIIEKELNLSFAIKWGGKPYRQNEVMTPWTGLKLPGWSPKVSIISGLNEVFDGINE